MERNSNCRPEPTGAAPLAEQRKILLRAYVDTPRRPSRRQRTPPSEWVLVFDCETTSDETQRLRFGTFQLRQGPKREKVGVFYDQTAISEQEFDCLQSEQSRQQYTLFTLDDFVRRVFVKTLYRAGGLAVGFNLPFDVSRLAQRSERAGPVYIKTARGVRIDRSMVGGFTFRLSEERDLPNVRVKHLSRRAAFINFAYPEGQPDARSDKKHFRQIDRERGYFLDLKTLSGSLLSEQHSLDSLAKALGVARKAKFHDYDRDIDPEYISYALRDVEVTRQCCVALKTRYDQHELSKTLPTQVYSGAGLGKGYLRQMGIKPWRQIQPDFDPNIIGAIISSYYGGRAEVHRRREIVPVLYTDFASMYPSVCTLMGLWRFVIAKGMKFEDATAEANALLETIAVNNLQSADAWRGLCVIVQVQPDSDIFPVRARYSQESMATIGVNFLSSNRPLWFTLADCISSKLLTGKAPRVLRAVRFTPNEPQDKLLPILIAGKTEYRIEPTKDDFYKRVVDLRRSVKKLKDVRKDEGAAAEELRQLDTDQLALKILANATSYGVFIEINVEDAEGAEDVISLHTWDGVREAKSNKREKPGEFFHPLLATLITGAARLMLTITECLGKNAGLDWIFCDTDSWAFAPPQHMQFEEFVRRVRNVCEWFEHLNPYEEPGSILEFEEQNYASGPSAGKENILEPLYCAAISAKRYVLFNFNSEGEPIIRKASAHGMGHLLPPYGKRSSGESESGVRPWQEDVWKAIVTSLRSANPMALHFDWRKELVSPAVSQLTAATPVRLDWFQEFNSGKAYAIRVKPFNFLLEFYAKRPDELARIGLLTTGDNPTNQPKPIAPFDRNPVSMIPRIWDRETGNPVDRKWLRSYAETLRAYHIHPETKFLNGEATDAGVTQRRHILVDGVEDIGKEANRWDDEEPIEADDEQTTSYGEASIDVEKMLQTIAAVSKTRLAKVAHVSTRSIPSTLADAGRIGLGEVRRLASIVSELAEGERQTKLSDGVLLTELRKRCDAVGLSTVARSLAYDVANLAKVVAGERSLSRELRRRIKSMQTIE